MYQPPDCPTLDQITETQIRLGLQGYPKTGKTWAALTFPNPIVLSHDHGLGAHIGRADIIEVPIWNPAYCKSFWPNYKGPTDDKYVVLEWLEKYGRKIEPDQTLVYDGGTGLQKAYHAWYKVNQVVTKRGEIDDFAQWRLKIDFFGDVCAIFKSLKCNVVYICHESEKKDKSGEYTGKIRPLLTGQFQDELVSHFTDWFRQHSFSAPKEDDEKFMENFRMSKSELKDYIKTLTNGVSYCWQTSSDNVFDGGCSSLINPPKFIPANYNSFIKYSRFASNTTKQTT